MTLPVLDPHAAFVDVGSEQMHVSIAGGPPEVFGTVTSQLHALRDWLLAARRALGGDGGHRRLLVAAVWGAGSGGAGGA